VIESDTLGPLACLAANLLALLHVREHAPPARLVRQYVPQVRPLLYLPDRRSVQLLALQQIRFAQRL
jgi:hypothetical protein